MKFCKLYYYRDNLIFKLAYYKRNLPHFLPDGYAYFVTFRLANTIPKQVYNEIKEKYNSVLNKISGYDKKGKKYEEYMTLQKYVFKKYETILDKADFGRKWLQNKEIAKIVRSALFHNDSKKYDLIAFTIMPNHVHIILKPYEKEIPESGELKFRQYILTEIIGNIKSYTATMANKILNRRGAFWQHESYDHVIRDEKELMRLVEYILNNPVKAKLCNSPDEWGWNYYNPELL